MVNFRRMRRKALQRLLRGGYTGVGAVLSGATGNWLSERIDNELAVDGAQIAVGAALSVGSAGVSGSGEMLDEDGLVSEAVEFAGYGIQAAGWDELFEDLELGITAGGGGQRSSRVVDVSARASRASSGGRQHRSSGSSDFLADVG